MGTKRTLIALVILGLAGCQYLPWGQPAAEPIFVGEPETIIVEPPDDAGNLSYNWRILDLPDESLLIPDFLATSNVFTFTADIEGEYTFSAIVNSSGEEVADRVFRYIAIEDTSVVPEQVKPAASTQVAAATPMIQAPNDLSKQITVAATARATRQPVAAAKPKPKPVKKARPKPAPRRKVAKDVVMGHYTIQVSSWNTAKKAQKIKQSLDGLGYDSYIQRVWLEDRNEVWWRVRLGDFTDVEEARRVKDKLAGQFANIWVDNMRKDIVETD